MSVNGNPCKDDFYSKGKEYWSQISADVDGMLGGLSCVNQADFEGSRAFLKSRNLKSKVQEDEEHPDHPLRVLDCGAGIGRVTKYVLTHFFDEIHLLEQDSKFLEQSNDYLSDLGPKVSHRYCQGIQEFEPLPDVKYDCIWSQWVIGHITDQDLKYFLDEKCSKILESNGFIVIKDNVSKTEECIEDCEDSSFTRSHDAYCAVFNNLVHFRLVRVIKQKNFPKELLPIRMYILEFKRNQ